MYVYEYVCVDCMYECHMCAWMCVWVRVGGGVVRTARSRARARCVCMYTDKNSRSRCALTSRWMCMWGHIWVSTSITENVHKFMTAEQVKSGTALMCSLRTMNLSCAVSRYYGLPFNWGQFGYHVQVVNLFFPQGTRDTHLTMITNIVNISIQGNCQVLDCWSVK